MHRGTCSSVPLCTPVLWYVCVYVRPGPDGRVWGGLFVEMKRADHSNGPTSEQRLWLERLRNAGYMAAVAYGAAEAIAVIENYLRGDA